MTGWSFSTSLISFSPVAVCAVQNETFVRRRTYIFSHFSNKSKAALYPNRFPRPCKLCHHVPWLHGSPSSCTCGSAPFPARPAWLHLTRTGGFPEEREGDASAQNRPRVPRLVFTLCVCHEELREGFLYQGWTHSVAVNRGFLGLASNAGKNFSPIRTIWCFILKIEYLVLNLKCIKSV